MVNPVNIKKSWFSIIPGVMGPYSNVLFQEFTRFGAVYPLTGKLFTVLFESPVDGGEAYGTELVLDGFRDVEWRLCLKEGSDTHDGSNHFRPVPRFSPAPFLLSV
jgi:hypothetical protein